MPFIQIKFENLYFSREVQEMCVSPSFKCPSYGHSWTCPPAAPYLEKAISTHNEFYIIYSKFDLEAYIKKERALTNRSEFYVKNMFLLTKSFLTEDLNVEFEKFLAQHNNPYKKRLLLYDGTCKFCSTQNAGECTYDAGEPCRYPKEKRFSMEAVGIEVIKSILELKIDGYPSNKYSYRFGLACFK
jgi:predicted metal-binding protein